MVASVKDRFLSWMIAVLALASVVVLVLMALQGGPRAIWVNGPLGMELAMSARAQDVTSSGYEIVNFSNSYGHSVEADKAATSGRTGQAEAKEGLSSKTKSREVGSPIGSNQGKLRKQS